MQNILYYPILLENQGYYGKWQNLSCFKTPICSSGTTNWCPVLTLKVFIFFQWILLTSLSADVLLIFTFFPAIVFSENCLGCSNMCFWNIPPFSTFCLQWKFPVLISRSFNWDNNCRFSNKSPKTTTREMFFFEDICGMSDWREEIEGIFEISLS